MAEDDNSNRAPFDFDKLIELVGIMEKHGLTEVSLKRGDQKWRLRRGPDPGVYTPAPAFPAIPQAQAPQAVAPAPEAASHAGTLTIGSPTVGTYYSSPTPDDPPFVSIGSPVQPETVVCIVEAMKVFNQIPAEVSGTVVEVLAKTGDSVEFGQPLFRVRPG